MKNRLAKTLVVTLIIVLLQSMVFGAHGASQDFQVVQTYWGSAATPFEAAPGDRGVTLNIVIQNIGSQSYTGLDATLYLSYPFSSVMGENTVHGYYGGTVQVGQTATLQFQLNIDSAAPTGSYSVLLNLNYGPKLSLGTSLLTTVLLLGAVQMKVSASPFSLTPGFTNLLLVTMSNTGSGTASKVSVALSFPAGLSVQGDNQWYFESVMPNENKTISLATYVQPSLAGSSVQVGAVITYTDAYGTTRTTSRTIGLKIQPITNIPVILGIGNTNLVPGASNTLTFSIANNQTKPLSSVQASLALPSTATSGTQALVIVGNNNRFFDSIEPHRNVTFEFKLMVPLGAAGMNYQFTLSLSYMDPYNVSRTETHNFGVRVLPVSRDTTLVSTDSNVLKAGAFNEPRITISNLGKSPIYSVTTTLLLPSAASSTSSSSQVVLATGNQWYFDQIAPNSNVTFSPKLFAALSAIDTSYQVQVSINYVDQNNVSRVETKSVGFSIKGVVNFAFNNVNVVPRTTYPGGNITITGELLNTGTSRALYTTLSIKPNPNFIQPLEGGIYIGEVATNVLSSFSMPVRVRPNVANGTYPLTLVFNYQDDYGDKFTSEKTVSIVVGAYVPSTPRPTAQPQQPNPLMNQYTYILVAVTAVSSVLLLYRRRKRHQE